MGEKIYNKLVRDKIPAIIESSGKRCTVETIEGVELTRLLKEKLQEEVDEYMASDDIEELADIVEVIYSILDKKGISIEQLESIRLRKKEKRGGFSKAIKLIKVYQK